MGLFATLAASASSGTGDDDDNANAAVAKTSDPPDGRPAPRIAPGRLFGGHHRRPACPRAAGERLPQATVRGPLVSGRGAERCLRIPRGGGTPQSSPSGSCRSSSAIGRAGSTSGPTSAFGTAASRTARPAASWWTSCSVRLSLPRLQPRRSYLRSTSLIRPLCIPPWTP